MKKLTLVFAVALVLIGLSVRPATALPPFKKAFEEKYVKSANDEEFTKAFKAAGCNVCHVKPKEGEEADRKLRNDYGHILAKLIPGEASDRMKQATKAGTGKAEMAKLLSELDAAFAAAEKEKAADGTTYGDLLKQKKLPQ